MAMPLTCPRGHQWNADELPKEKAQKCPRCGLAPVHTVANFQATLEFDPGKHEGDEPPSSDTRSTLATMPHSPERSGSRQAPILSQQVPGYEILGELGRGGMGVVYKARQIKLNRIVALKMILAGASADPQQLERFRAEAAAVALLHHPYIVQIYEINEHEGCPFFSLEFVDGGTLAQKLNGAPQPPRLAAQLVRLLALAMHSAHQKGVIHRDLKPGNILLATQQEHVSGSDSFLTEMQAAIRLYGIPKITDFGLAKHLDIQSQTRTGAIIGTPSYMAPEQAEGRTHAIGPGTDVYGLGAIFYEMLTGRPPFESESSLTTIRKLLGEDPLPPSHLHLKVPRDLETICLKCLEKDPVKRYPSAEALADDLQRFLSNQPIQARPLGWWGRSVKWVRRYPSRAAIAGILFVALIALLTFGAVYHLHLERAYAETRKYAEDSRRNLIRLLVSQGTSAMDAGDGFTALLWFTEALRLDSNDAEHQEAHRQRIAALMQGLPRPKHLWVHDGSVNVICFNADGSRTLTAGADGQIYLWDSETGKEAVAPIKAGGSVVQAVYSRDGRRIAAISSDGTARVWDAMSGAPLTPPLHLVGKPRWIDFSPDGKQIVTASGESACVWDVASAKQLPEELHHKGPVNVALFSPDGRWLASAGNDGLIRLWSAKDRRPTSVVLSHDRAVLCLAFGPDSKLIASGSADRSAQVWNVAEGTPVGRRLRHLDRILHVSFSPFGNRLLTCSEGGKAVIWRVADGEPLAEPLRHTSAVRWGVFSPDGCRIATASDDNTARVWSATTGSPLTPPLRRNGSVNQVVFSPDGRYLATASEDGTARLWDISCRHQGRVVNEAEVFRRQLDRDLHVSSLDSTSAESDAAARRTSPDGRFFLKINNDNSARVYDAQSGQPWTPSLFHQGEIIYAAFSPDSQRVVTTSVDRTARVWDIASGSPVGPPLKHSSIVWFADFNPDGQRLVTASDDNTARIWDISSGDMLVPPLRHEGSVMQARFSPEGNRVASGSNDLTARVWDATNGQSLSPPFQHPWSVRQVRFADNGRRLFTTGPSGTVWTWDLPTTTIETEDLVHLAQVLCCSRIDENRGLMPLDSGAVREHWNKLRQGQNEFLHISAEDVAAWHRQTAEECVRGEHWAAALWHLDRLIQEEPNNWLYHARRGRVRAELGHWAEARADFNEALRHSPEEVEVWCLYAVLCLHQGDHADYRRACESLLKLQEKGKSPRTAYLIVWTCLLSSESGVKSDRLVALAKQIVEREPGDPDYLCTLGAAYGRAEDLKSAVQRLNEARAIHGSRPCIREWLWFALVNQKMGATSEAREWLEKAKVALNAPYAATLPWVQRMQLDLLRREAEPRP